MSCACQSAPQVKEGPVGKGRRAHDVACDWAMGLWLQDGQDFAYRGLGGTMAARLRLNWSRSSAVAAASMGYRSCLGY